VLFDGNIEVISGNWNLNDATRIIRLRSPGGLRREAMSFLVYLAMLVVAVVSVAMGLDVVTAPPATKIAAKPALIEPIRHAAPATPAQPAPPAQPATAAQPPAPPQQTVSQSPDADQAPPQAAPALSCNVQACEAAYQSFRAVDCTYQPFDGPRRFCSK
jgi:type IV secretory pathway VirB10-like protein